MNSTLLRLALTAFLVAGGVGIDWVLVWMARDVLLARVVPPGALVLLLAQWAAITLILYLMWTEDGHG